MGNPYLIAWSDFFGPMCGPTYWAMVERDFWVLEYSMPNCSGNCDGDGLALIEKKKKKLKRYYKTT